MGRTHGNRDTRPRPARDQSHPLTFFLTRAERTAVLRALRANCADRATALLRALDLDGGRKS